MYYCPRRRDCRFTLMRIRSPAWFGELAESSTTRRNTGRSWQLEVIVARVVRGNPRLDLIILAICVALAAAARTLPTTMRDPLATGMRPTFLEIGRASCRER